MAYSIRLYTGDGVTRSFAVPPYLSKAHIAATLDGVTTTDYTWPTAGSLQFVGAPAAGVGIEIRRRTSPATRLVTFTNGAGLPEADLNTSALQAFYLAQEALDLANVVVGVAEGRLLPDGTPDDLALGFVDDPTTGLRRDSSGALVLATQGESVAVFHGSGDVSLGRDGSVEAFRVLGRQGGGLTTNRLEVYGAAAGETPRLKSWSTVDDDVDLKLDTKGAGRLVLPSAAISYGNQVFAQVTHLMPVKDGTGTTYYVPLTLTTDLPGLPDLGDLGGNLLITGEMDARNYVAKSTVGINASLLLKDSDGLARGRLTLGADANIIVERLNGASPAVTQSGTTHGSNFVGFTIGTTEVARVTSAGFQVNGNTVYHAGNPPPNTGRFVSGLYTLNLSGANLPTVSHGLGTTPVDFQPYVECVTANNGYSVGDRIPAGRYIPTWANATSVGGRTWPENNVFPVKGSGTTFTINSNWRMRYVAIL